MRSTITAARCLPLVLAVVLAGCAGDTPTGLEPTTPELAKAVKQDFRATYDMIELFGNGLPLLVDIVPDGEGNVIEHYVVGGVLTFKQNGRFKLTVVTRADCFDEQTFDPCGSRTRRHNLQGTYVLGGAEACDGVPQFATLTEKDGRQWITFFRPDELCPIPGLPFLDVVGGPDFAPFAPSPTTWARR